MSEKEIGKLLELLNEYCMGAFVYDNDILRFRLGDRAKIEGNAILISKSFGFIQRLVGQDKIDHAKLSNYFIDKKLFGEGLSDLKEFEILLMLLSISEQPIEFLISLLKNV